MAKRKSGKYSKELEQMRMLKSINTMLKSSDMENALLSNSAKESETVPDSVVDEMLGKISVEREKSKAIFDVEKITTEAAGGNVAHVRRSTHPMGARRAGTRRRSGVYSRKAYQQRKAHKRRKR